MRLHGPYPALVTDGKTVFALRHDYVERTVRWFLPAYRSLTLARCQLLDAAKVLQLALNRAHDAADYSLEELIDCLELNRWRT